MSSTSRIIVLVDMDCFYCQVEEKLDPKLEGKPIAVAQYNAGRGGGTIAVNYPARDSGVTRGMREDQARAKCPTIEIVRVPEVRGKANLTRYREAGKKVAEVLQSFTQLLERASVDEAYLDITEVVESRIKNGEHGPDMKLPNTFVIGSETSDFLHNIYLHREFSETDIKLSVGGMVTEEIRAEVLKKTGYKCSAGIAHNKILAKLVCGLHKPNKQTILPQNAIPQLFEKMPVKKIIGLGGKFGQKLTEKLGITFMGELTKFSEKDLSRHFDEKSANWLYNIARGINHEPVVTRLTSKSIGCCKNFPGKTSLTSNKEVEHWIGQLAVEIAERLAKDLEENKRKAKQLTVNFAQLINGHDASSSRSIPLNSYDEHKIKQSAVDVLKKNCLRTDDTYHITFLGLSVGQFVDNKNVREITSFFKKGPCESIKSKPNFENQNKDLNKKNNILKSFFTTVPQLQLMDSTGIIKNQSSINTILDKSVWDETNLTKDQNDCLLNQDEVTFYNTSTNNEDNKSVYSATTDEEEVPQHLIYYDDIINNMSKNQHLISTTVNAPNLSDDDSISNEIFLTHPNKPVIENGSRPSSSSFFQKFFENSSPAQRNFDTSKILEHEEDNTNNSDDDEVTEDILEDVTQDIVNDYTKTEEVDSDNLKDICPQCKKEILATEMVSHLDYHFALNMVKEESHLYNNTSNAEVPKKDQKANSKSVKRKQSTSSSKESSHILTFFQKDNSSDVCDDNSEVCEQCNKRIKLEDISSHMDYHTARKLHQELNSSQGQVLKSSNNTVSSNSKSNTKYVNKNVSKKAHSKNDKDKSLTVKSIDSFFKVT